MNTLDAQIPDLLARIAPDQPVLIAGPTASGKSALALAIAMAQGGVIVNADALQVFANWRVLTARPSAADEAMAPHRLYGHVAGDAPYSVGHWLRDVTPFLAGDARPIIVGGTGLNFAALTRGLVDIPPTPATVRAAADGIRARDFRDMLADLDAATLALIDTLNPMRVQRAWEVQMTTGRGLADWQADTPPPLLPVSRAAAFVMDADVDWLNARIARRFDVMLEQGALDEARENLHDWNPSHPASKAIGAPELIAYLRGEMDFDTAREKSIVASRQYAKRQRTWFRGHMDGYHKILLG